MIHKSLQTIEECTEEQIIEYMNAALDRFLGHTLPYDVLLNCLLDYRKAKK